MTTQPQNFLVKPPKFKGTSKEDLDTFLSQLKLRFEDAQITEPNRKATLTIECLAGLAASWVADKVNQLPEEKKVIPDLWKTYDDFTKYLREQSGQHYDLNETAETQLHNITQGESNIRIFNREFEKIMGYLPEGYGDRSLLYNYQRALKRRLRQQLATVPGSADWDLKTWMKNANNIERGAAYIQGADKEYKPQYGSKRQPVYHDPDAMDIDRRVVDRRSKGNKECYRCHKKGHFAADCRVKVGTTNTKQRPFRKYKWSKIDIVQEKDQEDQEEDSEDEGIDEQEQDFQ